MFTDSISAIPPGGSDTGRDGLETSAGHKESCKYSKGDCAVRKGNCIILSEKVESVCCINRFVYERICDIPYNCKENDDLQ